MKRILAFALMATSGLSFAQDPVVSAQVRMSPDALSNSGDETSAVATANGLDIIGGFNDYRTDGTIKASFGTSSDGGATWAHVLVRPPVANQTTVEGDPMAIYDERTNTVWAGAIAFGGNGGIYLAKKNIGSNTYQASVMARVSGGADKEWGCASIIPGNPNSTRLYIVYNEGVIRSDNLGSTWTTPLSLGSGLGFLPRNGPNGELYVTYWDTSFGIKFRRSLDGGLTFSAAVNAATRLATWGVQNFAIPGNFRNPPIHTMAVNPVTGDIVIMWFDQTNTVGGQRNLDLYMTKSTNQGTTWSAATRLPFRPLSQVSDMIYPWIEFTKDGRLHLLTFDTQYTPNQIDGVSHGLWDQTYYYSDDEGTTWSSNFRLTPSSWDSFNDGRNAGVSFLGDYEGIGISDRYVYPVYPDTRTNQAEIYTNKIYNPIYRPSSFNFFRGLLVSGVLSSLFLNDGNNMVARPGLTINAGEAPIQLETVTSGLTPPSQLKVYVQSSVSSVNIQQEILMLNVNTGQWDSIDVRLATTSESNTTVTVTNPSNYINVGNGQARTRVAYKPVGPVSNPNWQATIDQDVLLVYP